METTVTDFWNCFVKVQLEMLFAYENKDEDLVYQLFNQLEYHPAIREYG